MSPNSLCGVSSELTASITILLSDSKITEFMSLTIANFMAYNSPRASASTGGEEASSKFDKPETLSNRISKTYAITCNGTIIKEAAINIAL